MNWSPEIPASLNCLTTINNTRQNELHLFHLLHSFIISFILSFFPPFVICFPLFYSDDAFVWRCECLYLFDLMYWFIYIVLLYSIIVLISTYYMACLYIYFVVLIVSSITNYHQRDKKCGGDVSCCLCLWFKKERKEKWKKKKANGKREIVWILVAHILSAVGWGGVVVNLGGVW